MSNCTAPNIFCLTDYLATSELTLALEGNVGLQDACAVTEAFRCLHLDALNYMLAANYRNVEVVYPNGTFAINDRLMCDEFNNALWLGQSVQSRITFRSEGVTRLYLKGWCPGRASRRTDGIYSDNPVGFDVPNFVWEWSQATGRQYLAKIEGKIIIQGENDVAKDPMGFGFYRANAVNFGDSMSVMNLKNISIVFDSVFNSRAEQIHADGGVGYSITELGATGMMPQSVRYMNSGTTICVFDVTFDSSGDIQSVDRRDNFFKIYHVGLKLGLNRQGQAQNSPGEGSIRRGARWFEITSVSTDGHTCEVDIAPPYTGTSGQMIMQNRLLSFHAIRASTVASSNEVVLSAPICDNLVGRPIIIAGAGFADTEAGVHGENLTAQIESQETIGDVTTLTLSHAAARVRNNAPVSFGGMVHIGSLGSTINAGSTVKCDDLRFERAWCESGSQPAVPMTIQNVTKLTFGLASKLHGSPILNNWGANFTCVMMSNFEIRALGDFTHSRHSPFFGMFIAAGDVSRAVIEGGLTSWTADDDSAIWYVDNTDVAASRVWDVFFNVTDGAGGFPNSLGGQVFERGGPNYRPGLIKSGASQYNPLGERPIWPPSVMPPSRAPAWGSRRSDAESAVSRGNGLRMKA